VKVLIRADGGAKVGWGHLGRCAALAEVLIEAGAEVSWACRESSAVGALVGKEADLVLEGTPSMDALSEEEAHQVGMFASNANWLIVDHYGAHPRYLEILKERSKAQLMVLDDHQVRSIADLRLAPMQKPAPKTLSGASYQPVRGCFSKTRPSASRRGWLIALGGADPNDDMLRVVRELAESEQPLTLLASDAIAGRQGLDTLITGASGRMKRVAWMAPEELAESFTLHEAALVSSSTLSWEAMATKTPIVALQTADNQSGVAATLRDAAIPTFTKALDAAVALRQGRAALPLKSAKLDGLGAWRVAEAMGFNPTWPNALESEKRT